MVELVETVVPFTIPAVVSLPVDGFTWLGTVELLVAFLRSGAKFVRIRRVTELRPPGFSVGIIFESSCIGPTGAAVEVMIALILTG
jgi:hypothetical protein